MIQLTIYQPVNDCIGAVWADVVTTDAGEQRTDLKCTSYHPTQLALLQADAEAMGTPLDAYADMLAEWHLNYVPEPPKPEPVPQEVTALQGLLAIDAAGLSGAYEAWASSKDRTFAQKAFINKAQVWRRSDATLTTAAAALGLGTGDIDNLFRIAATL